MLQRRMRYLQLAFNQDSSTVSRLLPRIARSPQILIEAGTPYIKREGESAIRMIRSLWPGYIIADIKTADGAIEEVEMAHRNRANGVTVLGSAPRETQDLFIEACEQYGIDSFIDMINVEDPLRVLMKLKKRPKVVVLHKGRDEETTKQKVIKYVHIKRVKSKFDVLISAAGGIDLREAQSAAFNGADIVTVNIVKEDDPFEGISTDDRIEQLVLKFLESID